METSEICGDGLRLRESLDLNGQNVVPGRTAMPEVPSDQNPEVASVRSGT